MTKIHLLATTLLYQVGTGRDKNLKIASPKLLINEKKSMNSLTELIIYQLL